ncbi:MAG: polysaccharide deacetylase family protein, partial [Verrucomicrobiota bacterium]
MFAGLILSTAGANAITNAEKLGYPAGKRILMLHADDAGMCEEANLATAQLLEAGQIQSAAIMMPCPKAEEFIKWAIAHPREDLGMHLTLTSEWKDYRWGPVAPSNEVPGLIDGEGKLWPSVAEVIQHASAKEVEKEIRAQIDHAIALGYRPNHIDTHMGTLYGCADYVEVFFRVAEDYGIPANAMELSDPKVVAKYRSLGYPIDECTIELVNQYALPRLDAFSYIDSADTYDAKVENFKAQIRALSPGLTELVFHPSMESDHLKSLTHAWRQRVWELKMFSDPEVVQF